MARYLTYDYLQLPTNNFSTRHFRMALSEKMHSVKGIPIFLSHKHNEPSDLIEQVRGLLETEGANVYIDWLDDSMPEITNTETAEQLKQRISQCKKFIILATEESIKSIWIPWEIGLADQIKKFENIAVLPLVKDSSKWENREYMGLYKIIKQKDNKDWFVFDPKYELFGPNLKEWINT